MIVTIDGPAGAGKSTVARLLATRLGVEFLDTGAGYRAVALQLLRHGFDHTLAAERMHQLLADFPFTMQGGQFFLGDENVSRELRAPAVTTLAGKIASRGDVREFLTRWQQQYAIGKSLVTEGRDQGTVVFPEAVCKFFLTARPDVRVERRHKDLASRGVQQSREEVAAAQRERDDRDEKRAIAPLKPAPDAIHLDCSDLEPEQVVDKMMNFVQARSASSRP